MGMYNNKYWDKYLDLSDKLRILEHEREGLRYGTDEYISVTAKIECCLVMMDSSLEMSILISK